MSNYYCMWCEEVASKEPCEHCGKHQSRKRRAERLKGCHIRHLRTVDKDRNSRGVTVVCRPDVESGITRYGLSFCSPKEPYDKDFGIALALDRLENYLSSYGDAVTLPYIEGGWYLWVVLSRSFNQGDIRHYINCSNRTFRNTYMTWDVDHDWHLVQRKRS